MRLARKAINGLILLGIIGFLSACQQVEPEASFYVKSKGAVDGRIANDVIDVRMKNESLDIKENQVIDVTVGFGGDKARAEDGENLTWISIESEGCIIEDCKDSYKKYYPDFCTNDKYRAIEKERLWSYPELFSNYFEEFGLIFPEGECSGEVVFSFHDTLSNDAVTTISVSMYYAKTDKVVVFSAESEYDACQKLESLIAIK